MIRFSDGSSFDPTGEYRVELRRDGYYVLGGNMMFAVDTRAEGIERIRQLDPKAGIVTKWDHRKKTEPKRFFEAGRKYKIMKEGGRISWWVSHAGYQSSGGEELHIGDIVTFVGSMTVGGSDPGPACHAFQGKTGEGIFWPNDWGSVDESFFHKREE